MSGIIFGNSNGGGGGGGGGVTTLNNGLTLTGSNGQLGGALIKNTFIDNADLYQLTMGDTGGTNGIFRVWPGLIEQEIIGVAYTVIQISDGDLFLQTSDSGFNAQSMHFNGSVMQINDAAQNFGLKYVADYSANGHLNPRWIPDIGYIEANFGGAGIVASNKTTGVMASETLLTYPLPLSTPTQYLIAASCSYRTGSGSAIMSVAWTDTQGNAHTQNLSTASAVSGAFGNPLAITVLNGTSIVISVTVTGTVVVDCSSAISFLN